MNNLIGYFDAKHHAIPAYDPGLNVPCLICQKELSRPMITVSLMRENDTKSYFYRTHKECYRNIWEEEKTLIDESIIDKSSIVKPEGLGHD